jgi:hypothetical protein
MSDATATDLLNGSAGAGIIRDRMVVSDAMVSAINVDIYLMQVYLDKTYALDAQIASMMKQADDRKNATIKLQKRVDFFMQIQSLNWDAINPDTGKSFRAAGVPPQIETAAQISQFMDKYGADNADRATSTEANLLKSLIEETQGLMRQLNQDSDRDQLYLQQLSAQKNVAMTLLTSYIKEKAELASSIARNT